MLAAAAAPASAPFPPRRGEARSPAAHHRPPRARLLARLAPTLAPILVPPPKPSPMTPQQQAQAIQQIKSGIPPNLGATFDSLFAAWKKTWFVGALAPSSDIRARAQGDAYRQLLALGPRIIPLVIEKLNDPTNFVAISLYDDLQPSRPRPTGPDTVAASAPTDPRGRARAIVEGYLAGRA